MLYPQTRKVDHVDIYHGVAVEDPYRWLEDDNSPETAAWVAAQNEVTFEYLRSIPSRESFRARLAELWNSPRYGAPTRRGDRCFYFKNDGLQNQAVLYVQEGDSAPDAAAHDASANGASAQANGRSANGALPPDSARVLLDPNTLSPDGTIALSMIALTDGGDLLGYGISHSGSDWQELKVREVAGGDDLPDTVRWVKFSEMAWTLDGKGFFYSRYPETEGKSRTEAHLHHKLYYHRLGTDQSEDILIYDRPDEPDWRIIGNVTEDGRYLIIYILQAGRRNRLYWADLGDPMNPTVDAQVHRLIDSFDAVYEVVGNDGSLIYINSNSQAPHGKVIALDLAGGPGALNEAHTIVPESEDVIQSVSLVRDELVITYLHNAYSRVALFNLNGEFIRDLPLPTLGTVVGAGARRTASEIFYLFTSFLYPTTIFRYDMRSGENSIYRSPDLDFDRDLFETGQVWYTSKDGTQVPMFITHRKGLALDGSNPALLYGYGGFNNALTPFFSTSFLHWMEVGGVLVVPNLRGGGEFGDEWHRAGTLERKQNVFDDFIAAAEYLIDHGYTSRSRLALHGASNGGLLVGAIMCQRPDLFAVALPSVGVMDMLRYHKFTIGMAWRADYGLSDDPKMFEVLYSYSPLHNLKPGVHYPATLVTTADHDDRVVPAHSFKFAARLQECQGGHAPVLIRIETKAGHGSGKPVAMLIEEAADMLAFALHNMKEKDEVGGGRTSEVEGRGE